MDLLNKGYESAQKTRGNGKNLSLLKIAVSYAKFEERKKALEIIEMINAEDYKIMALCRVLAIWKSPEAFEKLEYVFNDPDSSDIFDYYR